MPDPHFYVAHPTVLANGRLVPRRRYPALSLGMRAARNAPASMICRASVGGWRTRFGVRRQASTIRNGRPVGCGAMSIAHIHALTVRHRLNSRLVGHPHPQGPSARD